MSINDWVVSLLFFKDKKLTNNKITNYIVSNYEPILKSKALETSTYTSKSLKHAIWWFNGKRFSECKLVSRSRISEWTIHGGEHQKRGRGLRQTSLRTEFFKRIMNYEPNSSHVKIKVATIFLIFTNIIFFNFHYIII